MNRHMAGSDVKVAVDLHFSKALFSLDPDILQLNCFLGLESFVLLFVVLSSRSTM